MSQKSRRFIRRTSHTRNPKLFILFGGIGLAGLILLLVFTFLQGRQGPQPLAAIEVHGAPSLKVNEEQINLGDVKLGLPVKVSFQITNVGDQPLRFSELPYIEVVQGC